MPRKSAYTREEIIERAFAMVRKRGITALTARNLGEALGCSARPIFTFFRSMDEVQEEVRRKAHQFFDDYLAGVNDYFPAFKEYGRRMVRFGKVEEHLFKLLFLSREASQNKLDAMAARCFEAMEKAYSLSREQVKLLFSQCWTFTCGMAVLNNTGAAAYSEEQIDELLSRQFISSLYFIKSGKELTLITPHLREDEDMTFKLDF